MEKDLWYGTSGPRDAKIVIVGEAWGVDEAQAERPFVGSSGTELRRILAEAGINEAEVLFTNVVAARPMGNEMWRLFHPKDAEDTIEVNGLHPTLLVCTELERLGEQIKAYPRKVIIPVGNYALWACTDKAGWDSPQDAQGRRTPTGIGNWRGSMTYDTLGHQCLPIYHPAAILRQWTLRAVTVHDLKTRVPQALSGDWRPQVMPHFKLAPSFTEAKEIIEGWLAYTKYSNMPLVGDVETKSKLVTCIGLGDSKDFAMSIPFVRPVGKTLESYYSPEEEMELIRLLYRLARARGVIWVGQNFAYDHAYFPEMCLIAPRTNYEDTMLQHHLMMPGTPKSLDYLASLHCRHYWYWKEDSREWDLKENLHQLLEYNAWDIVRTFEIWESQCEAIRLLGMEHLWQERKEVVGLAHRMMERGFLVDKEERKRQGTMLLGQRDEIYGWLDAVIPQSWVAEEWEHQTGKPFKSTTPWYSASAYKQQKILFRDVLGINLPNSRKTGNPTLGKEGIEIVMDKNPMLKPILLRMKDCRSLDVFYSHFIKKALGPGGRMFYSLNVGGTETFRFSSSENPLGLGTNMQNVPEGTKES